MNTSTTEAQHTRSTGREARRCLLQIDESAAGRVAEHDCVLKDYDDHIFGMRLAAVTSLVLSPFRSSTVKYSPCMVWGQSSSRSQLLGGGSHLIVNKLSRLCTGPKLRRIDFLTPAIASEWAGKAEARREESEVKIAPTAKYPDSTRTRHWVFLMELAMAPRSRGLIERRMRPATFSTGAASRPPEEFEPAQEQIPELASAACLPQIPHPLLFPFTRKIVFFSNEASCRYSV